MAKASGHHERCADRPLQKKGVHVQNVKGRVEVAAGSEMGLLEVLDRRRYELGLVPTTPERYRASSRTKIGS